ncbi:MAG: hypothetical protein E6J72_04890 [Deltaproteobacteria bacterium]|nr:MAG: hypothetical protein E6J72_04890 [Deltaproteobacteria bacterium]
MRESVLERIVRERTAYTTVGTISVAVDRLAEELAREVLADEEFRKSFHALIRSMARDIMDQVRRRDTPSSAPGKRRRRGQRPS